MQSRFDRSGAEASPGSSGASCAAIGMSPRQPPNRNCRFPRLLADPRVALLILSEGDVALTAYGNALVVQEDLVDGVVAVEIEVQRVQNHGRDTFVIEAAVRWRWTDPVAQARDGAAVSAAAAPAAPFTRTHKRASPATPDDSDSGRALSGTAPDRRSVPRSPLCLVPDGARAPHERAWLVLSDRGRLRPLRRGHQRDCFAP